MSEGRSGSLEGRVALVTGGAQNIGLAIARALAGRGALTVLGDVNREGAERAAELLRGQGREARAWELDVADAASVGRAAEGVVGEWGRLDILVNNAGVTRDGLLVRMSEEDWERVLAVNLTGAFHCSRAAAKQMMRQRSGRIINIASVIGLTGNVGQTNYAASKAGLIGFTKSLARELASRGVTANAIAPGFIETAMTEALSAEVRGAMLARIPVGRFGRAEDVAGLAAFLASEEAGYITGQVFTVDGGMVM